ncbi:hypothetical protein RHSIM_Rhsim01G0170100 [Rhododendron simsii]|uniref:Uncharacterized protein n=1 Tax=Rhododendron simsii TaxID=118357 RepID=A0A834HJC7_RHOSS|nr:hypothetical protein RHSIM_Rhsim01G0170100 [Rhododendron simsii]
MSLLTSGVSSTTSWGKRIDDADAFFPRPYAEPVEGVLPTSFFSENDRTVDFQTKGITVSTFVLATFVVAARPCSLPALCTEGTCSMLYHPDRGFNVVVLLRNDREIFFTANDRLAWRRNLDSFINYVRGVPEILTLSDVYHRDVSLRVPLLKQQGPFLLKRPLRASRLLMRFASPFTFHWLSHCFIIIFSPVPLCSVGSSLRHEGKEHTPSNKLKRKREDEEAREGDSDSSIDDTVQISRFFKLPRTTQSSPGGTSVTAGKKVVVDLAEGNLMGPIMALKVAIVAIDGDDEDHSGDGNGNEDLSDGEEGNGAEDENDGDGNGDEGCDGGEGDGENLGADTTHFVVEEDEEDDDESSLIPRRRIPTEGFLLIPDINQLALAAVAPQLPRREVVKSAFDPFHRSVNIPPTGDPRTFKHMIRQWRLQI